MDEDWPEVEALAGAGEGEPEEDDDESDEVVDFDPLASDDELDESEEEEADESLPDEPERLSVR